MRDQIATVQCADMLVGIHGAGLEHYRFMQRGAFLLQLGWKHWEADQLYDISPRLRGIGAKKVNDACEPVLSAQAWKIFHEHNPTLVALSKKEVFEIAENLNVWMKRFSQNIWKYADCDLDVTKVVEIVSKCVDSRNQER